MRVLLLVLSLLGRVSVFPFLIRLSQVTFGTRLHRLHYILSICDISTPQLSGMAGRQCIALLAAVQCALVLSMTLPGGATPLPEQTNAKASAVPTWSEHDSADFEHACLRATTVQQCNIVGFLAGVYFEYVCDMHGSA
jgi:hypothetical protein